MFFTLRLGFSAVWLYMYIYIYVESKSALESHSKSSHSAGIFMSLKFNILFVYFLFLIYLACWQNVINDCGRAISALIKNTWQYILTTDFFLKENIFGHEVIRVSRSESRESQFISPCC